MARSGQSTREIGVAPNRGHVEVLSQMSETLLAAMRRVLSGKTWVSPSLRAGEQGGSSRLGPPWGNPPLENRGGAPMLGRMEPG